jgi:hypothetical protein
MDENNESFGNELIKLANIVEIIESSFIGKNWSDVEIKVSEETLTYIAKNLNHDKNDKIIISIGSVNFIFLKK